MRDSTRYMRFLSKLDIPDYTEKIKSIKEIRRFYNKNDDSETIDLEPLDLSLGQQDKLTRSHLGMIPDSLDSISKYTFTQDEELISLISKYHQVPTSKILITAGCDGALRLISQILIQKDATVCIPLPSFYRFEYHTKMNQGKPIFLKPTSFPYDIDLDKLSTLCKKEDPSLVFLANPNNPTGIHKSRPIISDFLDSHKGYLVLDEALVISENQSLTKLLPKYPRLIITRSFSKQFGLAGLRIGYMLADQKLIEYFKIITSPFEVNSIAIALAKTVMSNPNLYSKSTRDIKNSLKIIRSCKNNTIKISPSVTSTFVIESSKRTNLLYNLLRKGIQTVSCKDFRGLEGKNSVRVSIRNQKSMRQLCKALTDT